MGLFTIPSSWIWADYSMLFYFIFIFIMIFVVSYCDAKQIKMKIPVLDWVIDKAYTLPKWVYYVFGTLILLFMLYGLLWFLKSICAEGWLICK